jgi:hypothetical protein
MPKSQLVVPKAVRIMLVAGALGLGLTACAPTIRIKVDPISIYAKLDADVRIRLDKEVQALIQQNPDLF